MKTTHFAEKSFFSFVFGTSSSFLETNVQQEEEQQQQQQRWRWQTTAAESPFVFFRNQKKKITRIPRNKTIEQPNNRQHIFHQIFPFFSFFLFVSAPKKENNIEIRIFFFSRSSLKDISLSSLVLPLVVLFLFGDGEGGGARDTFQQYNIQNQQINKNVLLNSKKRNNRTTGAREGAAGGAKVCVCVCVSFIQSSTPKTERARDSVKHFAFFFSKNKRKMKNNSCEMSKQFCCSPLGRWESIGFPFFIKSSFVLFSLSSEHEMGGLPSNTVNLFPLNSL